MLEVSIFQLVAAAVFSIGAIGLFLHREHFGGALISICIMGLAGLVNLAGGALVHGGRTGVYMAIIALLSGLVTAAVAAALLRIDQIGENSGKLSNFNEMKG